MPGVGSVGLLTLITGQSSLVAGRVRGARRWSGVRNESDVV